LKRYHLAAEGTTMLDVRFVADNLDQVSQALARRAGNHTPVLEQLAELSRRRLELIQRTEGLQAEQNSANQAMSQLA
jgi:seryl-tRNA synthetase